jgi:hypothetical protein
MNGSRETRPGSDAPIGAIALHRDMRNQALKVRWRELAAACDQLARWRSFSLWVRAIVDTEHSLPEWLATTIEDHCPAFLQSRRGCAELPSLWLDLNEWIDFHFFSAAIQGGWIQALHYYYGRQPIAEAIWQQWTQMNAQWQVQRPEPYPTFEQWQMPLANVQESAATLEFVEWEAFALWVRSLVEASHGIPAVVRSAITARCPGFEEHIRALREKPCADAAWLWEELRGWIERQVFAEPNRSTSIETLRADAHRTLRSERISDYWAGAQLASEPPFPAFETWLANADAFVVR